MKASVRLKICLLRINHIHLNTDLHVSLISTPIWTRYAAHVAVEDNDTHCLRLSIDNWSYVTYTRQIMQVTGAPNELSLSVFLI